MNLIRPGNIEWQEMKYTKAHGYEPTIQYIRILLIESTHTLYTVTFVDRGFCLYDVEYCTDFVHSFSDRKHVLPWFSASCVPGT